jgi:hypothetical protein
LLRLGADLGGSRILSIRQESQSLLPGAASRLLVARVLPDVAKVDERLDLAVPVPELLAKLKGS